MVTYAWYLIHACQVCIHCSYGRPYTFAYIMPGIPGIQYQYSYNIYTWYVCRYDSIVACTPEYFNSAADLTALRENLRVPLHLLTLSASWAPIMKPSSPSETLRGKSTSTEPVNAPDTPTTTKQKHRLPKQRREKAGLLWNARVLRLREVTVETTNEYYECRTTISYCC